MKMDIRILSFLQYTNPDRIGIFVKQIATEYLSCWNKPINQTTFTRIKYGNMPFQSWKGSLDDIESHIVTATKQANGIFQWQWHIQDSLGNQYLWIRLHLFPLPNVLIEVDDINTDLDKKGLLLQENILERLVQESVVDVGRMKSRYVGRRHIIYLYIKLSGCRMLEPVNYVNKTSIDPDTYINAFAAITALLEKENVDNQMICSEFNTFRLEIERVDSILRTKADICEVWIQALGCTLEEWFNIK